MKMKLLEYLEGDIVDGDYGVYIGVSLDSQFYEIQKNYETNKVTIKSVKELSECPSIADLPIEKKIELEILAGEHLLRLKGGFQKQYEV